MYVKRINFVINQSLKYDDYNFFISDIILYKKNKYNEQSITVNFDLLNNLNLHYNELEKKC